MERNIPRSFWRRALLSVCQMTFVIVLIVIVGALSLSYVIHGFILPMKQGELGKYGIVENSRVFTPGTRVLSFEARYVPTRILWFLPMFRRFTIPWPVSESLEVTVTYRRPDDPTVKTWEHTYLEACDIDRDQHCVGLYELIGLELHGRGIDTDGHGSEYEYIYLRGQILPVTPACS